MRVQNFHAHTQSKTYKNRSNVSNLNLNYTNMSDRICINNVQTNKTNKVLFKGMNIHNPKFIEDFNNFYQIYKSIDSNIQKKQVIEQIALVSGIGANGATQIYQSLESLTKHIPGINSHNINSSIAYINDASVGIAGIPSFVQNMAILGAGKNLLEGFMKGDETKVMLGAIDLTKSGLQMGINTASVLVSKVASVLCLPLAGASYVVTRLANDLKADNIAKKIKLNNETYLVFNSQVRQLIREANLPRFRSPMGKLFGGDKYHLLGAKLNKNANQDWEKLNVIESLNDETWNYFQFKNMLPNLDDKFFLHLNDKYDMEKICFSESQWDNKSNGWNLEAYEKEVWKREHQDDLSHWQENDDPNKWDSYL